mmetsp:Transcript_17004/g.34495  ORF Transcript_17004/g.34495 Transcript_17004/m.34495 type:complete len:97 (+) Transcript_17004:263-553(+)
MEVFEDADGEADRIKRKEQDQNKRKEEIPFFASTRHPKRSGGKEGRQSGMHADITRRRIAREKVSRTELRMKGIETGTKKNRYVAKDRRTILISQR